VSTATVAMILLLGLLSALFLLLRGAAAITPAQRQAFVSAEAKGLCTVQRTSYRSQGGIAHAYASAEASSGLRDDVLHRLRTRLEKDPQLAREITSRYRALCGA
jgi:hypothetical protein